jgi:hypothetical protein
LFAAIRVALGKGIPGLEVLWSTFVVTADMLTWPFSLGWCVARADSLFVQLCALKEGFPPPIQKSTDFGPMTNFFVEIPSKWYIIGSFRGETYAGQ